ncbi:thioredoxin domain-containing protein [Polaribacter pacificus]|nr:thioredoxin domain-containing protein [Polaribacter pacificus]
MTQHQHTNKLINETSPYLLQHAHNPVNWHPWNEATLALARKEKKLLLISIGYAACHWCHVMEHESFEDETVAAIMNHYFINIKVDREERPDVDQLYMTAVQLMTGNGGWPLNCIALPNGKPVWGGIYFKPEEWKTTLTQIGELYLNDPEKVLEYAEKLTEGIHQTNLVQSNDDAIDFNTEFLERTVKKWSLYFDEDLGGYLKAPKFPMPNNYHFLLRYAYQFQDKNIGNYVHTTLTQMAFGGLFDQVGGGFSRYSVDAKWHIPHFEKMLYDNGQLVSLYADAYLASKEELYKETIISTLEFVERELLDDNGGFYASLDADSLTQGNQLKEGAYYVWTTKELQECLQEDYILFAAYYNVNSYGYWEENNYHLIRTLSDDAFSKAHDISIAQLKHSVKKWKKILLERRNLRSAPRLDDKILCSWNALMLKGYLDAYKALEDPHYLEIALQNARFIQLKMIKEDGTLYRNYKGEKASITAFLEDYATLIEAYICLYQVSLDEQWLWLSKNLTDVCFDQFYDQDSQMFYFTSTQQEPLIAKNFETEDNVLPSSNSIMAKNLFVLSHYFSNAYYLKVSQQMLHTMTKSIENYGSGYSNWLDLYANFTGDYFEIAISGDHAEQELRKLQKEYIPNKLVCASRIKSQLDLLKNRYVADKTYIYLCQNNRCSLPTDSLDKVFEQLKKA